MPHCLRFICVLCVSCIVETKSHFMFWVTELIHGDVNRIIGILWLPMKRFMSFLIRSIVNRFIIYWVVSWFPSDLHQIDSQRSESRHSSSWVHLNQFIFTTNRINLHKSMACTFVVWIDSLSCFCTKVCTWPPFLYILTSS